jgi:hypothetical protein
MNVPEKVTCQRGRGVQRSDALNSSATVLEPRLEDDGASWRR